MRLLFPLLLLTVPARTAPIELEFGRFVITVSDSWTAQVFHIVDQLSQWDQYAHKAYMRWARTNLVLDAEDKRLLEQHASMRKARGWGNVSSRRSWLKGPSKRRLIKPLNRSCSPPSKQRRNGPSCCISPQSLRSFATSTGSTSSYSRRNSSPNAPGSPHGSTS